MGIGDKGNVLWVDGLRGLASFTVVITHIARAFVDNVFRPCDKKNGPMGVLQWPYIRVFIQGRIGVAIFCMVTGYVCALKPAKLISQGNYEAAYASVAKSSLRRIPRIALPATIATWIIWVPTQLGAFKVAKHSGSPWLSNTSPRQWPTLLETIWDPINNIILTWTRAMNSYDPNQWTLMPLLKGGMLVYVYIVATSRVAPKYRMLVALSMWMYYYQANAAWYFQFFWGAFLIELQNFQPATDYFATRPRLSRFLSIFCMAFGMFIASAPEYDQDWAVWSNVLRTALDPLLPRGVDYPMYTTGIGLEFISLSIYFSPWLRDILSNKYFLWLGKNSFAVYLLHGPLMRTVLAWMLFGFNIPADHKNDKDEWVQTNFDSPSFLQLLACLPFWIPLVYAAAVGWTTYVDAWCGRLTEKLVSKIKEETTEKTLLPVRQD